MGRIVKKGLAILMACMVGLTGGSVPAVNAADNFGRPSHGTNRNEMVDEAALNNTPPTDYVIPEGTQAKAKEGRYDKYFLKDDLQTVSITLEEDNLNWLLQNAGSKPSVMTKSVTIGDTTLSYAGLKTKGNFTLAQTNASSSDRFSFTVNFGKYIKKKNGYPATQNFYGCDKISFNNFFFDKTMMKEYNALRVMTELGVPTPQYGLAKLYLNNKYYGVYFMVEAMDSSILEQYLDTSSKNISSFLVKPNYYSPYYYDVDFENCKDPATGLITKETLMAKGGLIQDETGEYRAVEPLSYYSGLWENDSDTLQDVADMLPTALNWEEKLTNLSNGKDFRGNKISVNSQEYINLLNQIMDVDEVIRYFAAHSFIIQMDYLFNNRQNYAIYLNQEGRAMILPWDYDLGWGCYFEPITSEDVANWNIDIMYHSVGNEYSHMSAAEVYRDFPLYHVIYQNLSLRKKMHTYMEDCSKIAGLGGVTSDNRTFEAGRFSVTMDKLYNKVAKAASESLADNVYYLNNISQPSGVKNGIPNLNKLIARRCVGVWLQTQGITGTKVTGYGCDSSTLGNAIDRTVTGSTTGNLTIVDEKTGIFASAAYVGNRNVGPSLTVRTMEQKNAEYTKIESKVRTDLAAAGNLKMSVYEMSNTKTPTSAYKVYLPVNKQGITIYSYDKAKAALTKLEAVRYGHICAVTTADISCLVVAEAVSADPGTKNTTVGPDEKKTTDSSAVQAGTVLKDKKTGASYKVKKGGRTVEFLKTASKKKSVTIPASVKLKGKTYKVTSIKAGAFKNNKKLKKVTIGIHISKIGKNAFYGCKKLKTVIIKTKKLSAGKVGARAWKGIYKKATIKVPKKKRNAYRKWLKKKGITGKMKIVKI